MNNQPISIKAAAELLGVSYDVLYYQINTHKIHARKLSRELYFLPEDIDGLRNHFAAIAARNEKVNAFAEASTRLHRAEDEWYAAGCPGAISTPVVGLGEQ